MPKAASPVRERTQIVMFRRLLQSHARVTEAAKALLAGACGLSMIEFDMVAELGGQPPMRMGDLGKRMITSPSSVTRIAQGLESKGLLKRQRDPDSERVVLVQLTKDGEAFFKRHFGNVAGQIAGLFDDRLNAREQAQLVKLLGKLATADSEAD